MRDVAVIFVAFILLFSGLLIVINYAEKRACASKGVILDMESKYSFYSGCFVQRIDGKFIPLNSIRGNEF
jgi:hypothetical protein